MPRQNLSVTVVKSRRKVTKMPMTVTGIYGISCIPNLINVLRCMLLYLGIRCHVCYKKKGFSF